MEECRPPHLTLLGLVGKHFVKEHFFRRNHFAKRCWKRFVAGKCFGIGNVLRQEMFCGGNILRGNVLCRKRFVEESLCGETFSEETFAEGTFW